MVSEKLNPNVEHESNRVERHSSAEREDRSSEREMPPEKHQERLEAARKDAKQESVSSRKIKAETEAEPAVRIGKHDKDRAYRQTMGLVQASLPRASRNFSRIIHQPAIARVSEAAEKTVARPKAVLGAGLAAAIGLAIMLFFARRYGFSLSGSEFIILLVGGWSVGTVIDLLGQRFNRSN